MFALLKVVVLTSALFSLAGMSGDIPTTPAVEFTEPVMSDMNHALFTAIAAGDVERIPELIDAGADVNATRADGWTPLMAAAGQGHPDIVRELLATGADPRARTLDGWTPLLAALEGGNEEVVLTLLEEEAVDAPGITPDAPRQGPWLAAEGGAPRRH